jgi:hypothetical protein
VVEVDPFTPAGPVMGRKHGVGTTMLAEEISKVTAAALTV